MFNISYSDGVHDTVIDEFQTYAEAENAFKQHVGEHDGSYAEFELVETDDCDDYVDTHRFHIFSAN